MTEIVTTTGRRMSIRLQQAIDGLADRGLCIRALEQMGQQGGRLSNVYAALALELRLSDLRELETLRQMAVAEAAAVPEPPLPEATGPAVYIDPDTGDITELEG
jgi:hypothetical protein